MTGDRENSMKGGESPGSNTPIQRIHNRVSSLQGDAVEDSPRMKKGLPPLKTAGLKDSIKLPTPGSPSVSSASPPASASLSGKTRLKFQWGGEVYSVFINKDTDVETLATKVRGKIQVQNFGLACKTNKRERKVIRDQEDLQWAFESKMIFIVQNTDSGIVTPSSPFEDLLDEYI